MSFYLRTLGQLTLHPEGPDSEPVLSESKSLAILALLAVAPDHSMARDHLSELLWPGTDHRRARRSLRQSLYYLTQQAGRELIESENGHVRLRVDTFDCDLWEFDRAIQAKDHLAVADSSTGRFLQSLERKLGRELSEWVDLQNQRLRSARRDAYGRLIEQSLAKGDGDEATRFARDYAARRPLDEKAQLQLIRTLKHVGDEAGAFRAYEEYRSLIRAALEDEPSDEMEEAVETVRQVLLADREWKPIAADPEAEALSVVTARRWAICIVATGIVIGAGATTMGRAVGSDRAIPDPNSRLDLLEGRVIVTLSGTPVHDTVGRRDLVLEGMESRLEAPTIPMLMGGPGFVVSPDSQDLVYEVTHSDARAIDLYLGAAGARPELLLTGPGDQRLLARSPDGRQLLVGLGTVDPETEAYSEPLAIYDIESRRLRKPFFEYDKKLKGGAAWSPDGTLIAISAEVDGRHALQLFGADGSNFSLSVNADEDEYYPAWSPGSDWLALIRAYGSDRRLVLLGRDSDSVVVAEDLGSVETPLWLSERIILIVRDVDGVRDVWAWDRVTNERRRLTECGCVATIDQRHSGTPAGPWIDAIALRDMGVVVPPDTVTPGLDVEWSDGADRDVRGVLWESTDTTVAIPLENGRIAVRAAGKTQLVASAAGWRSDTLAVVAAPLLESSIGPSLTEEWTGDLDGLDRWYLVGDPIPYTRPTGGPDGAGVFVNNGDLHHASGALSREWFSTVNGVTVEAWGLVPVTGRQHQVFSLYIETGDGPPPMPRPFEGEVMNLAVSGESGAILFAQGVRGVEVGRSGEPSKWHLYALQWSPGGMIDVLVDGDPVWRGRNLMDADAMPDSIRIGVGSRSLGGEVLHGTLRVYEGLKYVPGGR